MADVRSILDERNFMDKTVVLRIDSDVDVPEGGVPRSEKRLEAATESIDYIIGHGGKVILVGHFKRPDKEFQISNFKFPISNELKRLSLKPVAEWFAKRYGGKLEEAEIDGFPAWKITDNISLLENIRFYEGEEANDSEFSKKLASLGDMFVNEAFAVSHRKHASVYGITHYLPSYAGKHFMTEIEVLTKVMTDPDRPLVIIIGGAKIETKLPMVDAMHKIADYILVGGEVAAHTKELIKVMHEKIEGEKAAIIVADLNDNGLNITPISVENFIQVIQEGKTIVWNGPVGQTDHAPEDEESSLKLAHAIAETSAYSIIGGGDTASFLGKHHLLGKFDFISTGGGAMLEFLSGNKLPGIEALEE